MDCTARGDNVLDPFLGSGTTVIAVERGVVPNIRIQQNRRARVRRHAMITIYGISAQHRIRNMASRGNQFV